MRLQLQSVSVGYGATKVVQDVSFDVESGTFVSLIGPNGAGKTTLLNAISGQLPLTTGRIEVGEVDISRWKADRRARAGIGRSFQTTNLFANLSALENVQLAVQARQQTRWFDMVRRVQRQIEEESLTFLAQVGLVDGALKPARSLSHGDKRKLELAMLLALKPQVLLLDEPTAGMALAEVPAMLDLISELKDTRQFTIILVEHKLDVVMKLSDRVVVLQQGMVLADGTPEEVVRNPHVQTAYLGGNHEGLA